MVRKDGMGWHPSHTPAMERAKEKKTNYHGSNANTHTHTFTHAYTPTRALDDVAPRPPFPPHPLIPPHPPSSRLIPPHTRTHREIQVARLPPGLRAAGGEGKA